MFTGSRGECDRLDSGNSLISAGRSGNVVEVNPDNEIVWHLNVKQSGYSVTIYRTERVLIYILIVFHLLRKISLGIMKIIL